MTSPRLRLLPFAAALLGLLLGGCYYSAGPGYYTTQAPGGLAAPSTALVIVMPDNSTEADYLNWRAQIIDYLIQRGYIVNESDLVANPDDAQRIVRAIVANDGYTLSVFNQDGGGALASSGPLDLEDSDVLYPDDPYFILGFTYFGEIGRRRLPPRPPGYRPHPHPPGWRPPAGHHPDYDRVRHWPGPHGNPPNNRPRPPAGKPDDRNGRPTPPRNDPRNPSTPPNRPPPKDDGKDGRHDGPGHDDRAPAKPSDPRKPDGPDHRNDIRPAPERNDQPHAKPFTPPPSRPQPAANPTPSRPVERPAPPPPKAEPPPARVEPKDDDKRPQAER